MELLDFPEEILDNIVSLLGFNDWKHLSRTNKFFFDFTTSYIVESCVIQTNRTDKNLCRLGELQRTYVNVKVDNKPIITNDSITPKNVYISVNNSKVATKLLKNSESFQFINNCPSVKNVFLNIQSNELEDPNVTEFLLRKDINFYIDKLTISFKTSEHVWAKVKQWFSVCPTIRKLCILVGRYSEEDEVGELEAAQLNFKELSLKNIGNKQLILKLVNSSKKLRWLKVENCILADLHVSSNLYKFECINNEIKPIHSIISSQRFLESLIIDNVLFTEEFLKILSSNNNLYNLEIYNCQNGENILPKAFEFVSRMVNLKLFSLSKSKSSIEGTRITDIEETGEVSPTHNLEEMIWNHMQNAEYLNVQLGSLSNLHVKYLDRLKHLEIVDIGGKTSIAINEHLVADNLVYCLSFSNESKMFPKCEILNVCSPLENLSSLETLLEVLNKNTFKTVYLKWYSINSQLLELLCKSNHKDITFYIDFPVGYAMIFNYEKTFELASSFKGKYSIEVEPADNKEKSFMIIKDSMKVVMRV